jgi:hypothetical protein
MCGALSDERTGRLQMLLVLASAVIFESEYRGTRDHILLSQIRDSPNLVKVEVKVKVNLRLAVYCQSVRLGVKPLEPQDLIFFYFK